MKVKHILLVLVLATVAALALVHLRTQKVTLGYDLARERARYDELAETKRKQQLQQAVLTSPAALARRMAETPVDLVPPENAADFIEPEETDSSAGPDRDQAEQAHPSGEWERE